MEAKRADLLKLYAGLNQNELGYSKTLQDRSRANVKPLYKEYQGENKGQPPAGSERKQTMLVSSLARSKQNELNRPKLYRIESRTKIIILKYKIDRK